MMTIHATKKLMAKLPVNEAGLLPLREKTIYRNRPVNPILNSSLQI